MTCNSRSQGDGFFGASKYTAENLE